MERTPSSLLQRLRQPDTQGAWERFVDLYTPLIYFWACRAGLQAQDAADLVQDVFVILLEKLPTFVYDRGRSFRSWLRTVTLNRWRDGLRRKATAATVGLPAAEPAVPDAAESLWEAEYREFLVGRAAEVMKAEFQPQTWQACWALVVEGKAGAVVAAEQGMSLAAVYAARSRVLRRLHQELEGLLD
jgi:RNA polymerase sigma-70 factor (ECF subfamily)